MPVHHTIYNRMDVLPTNQTIKESNVFVKFSEFASLYYWIDMRTGICVPNKCSEEDIASLAKRFAEEYGLEYRRVKCQTNIDSISYSFGQIIAM